MNGTIFSVTLAMLLMPPMITAPTAAAKSRPRIQVLRPRKLSSPPTWLTICAVAWLDWNMLPPPTAPPIMQMAKKAARNLPNPGFPRPPTASRR